MTVAAAPQYPDGDLLEVRRRLPAEEEERLQEIEAYAQANLRAPSIDAWNEERFLTQALPAMADLGLAGLEVDGSSRLFKGLAHAAVAQADVSMSAVMGIHNELIVGLIHAFGSAAQRDTWLARLTRFETLGAFCLTEPDHGSDIAGGLATTARRDGDSWVLNGTKRWIGMATIADVALVWARDVDDDAIKCFLVETNTPGYHAEIIRHKMGLRGIPNADVVLEDLRVPAEALLPGARSFADTNVLLRSSRAWVGWQAVGLQHAVLDVVRDYVAGRDQFGRPLASFQLIQQAIAEITGNLTSSTALMVQVTELQQAGRLEMVHAATVKSTTTRLARASAAIGREALGGNGLTSEYEASKLMGDAEAIYTYEGSYGINSLIVGRAMTGVSAFV
ncbi:acyl-CoA dehydrogenase family protein [Nesterenkonia xinjiangensis]|uniref:acyl-CoA dehydrogenase family protein n=1 Tax=Nesterenkonia xinjiangensis TaxID=225327 RepID=UPI0015C81534